MKSKLFRSVLLCVMAFALAFGVVACGDKPVTPGPDQTGNAVARYATDTRAKAFGVYTVDGDVQEEFNDMYKAIAYCVENGDEGKVFALTEYADRWEAVATYKARKDFYTQTFTVMKAHPDVPEEDAKPSGCSCGSAVGGGAGTLALVLTAGICAWLAKRRACR